VVVNVQGNVTQLPVKGEAMKIRRFYIAVLIELKRNLNTGLTTTELSEHFNKNHTQSISRDIRALKKMGYVVKDGVQTSTDKRAFKHRISDEGLRLLADYKEELSTSMDREMTTMTAFAF
jgi:DNA-binding MarR family transcriptional regulator